jgi:hypothetical protein
VPHEREEFLEYAERERQERPKRTGTVSDRGDAFEPEQVAKYADQAGDEWLARRLRGITTVEAEMRVYELWGDRTRDHLRWVGDAAVFGEGPTIQTDSRITSVQMAAIERLNRSAQGSGG